MRGADGVVFEPGLQLLRGGDGIRPEIILPEIPAVAVRLVRFDEGLADAVAVEDADERDPRDNILRTTD